MPTRRRGISGSGRKRRRCSGITRPWRRDGCERVCGRLLGILTETGRFERVALQTEGPIAHGHAYLREELFLRFYFNEATGTTAFALIEKEQRIWGIDYDNRRGWHMHPVDTPTDHIGIDPMSVSEIIARLQSVLLQREIGL